MENDPCTVISASLWSGLEFFVVRNADTNRLELWFHTTANYSINLILLEHAVANMMADNSNITWVNTTTAIDPRLDTTTYPFNYTLVKKLIQ